MFRISGKKVLALLTLLAVYFIAAPVFAADAIPGGESYNKILFAVGAMIGAGIAIGFGALGAGAGIGSAAGGACQAVGRNPGVQGKILMTMLVGMAMAESCAIYALVVSLLLLFANPFMNLIAG